VTRSARCAAACIAFLVCFALLASAQDGAALFKQSCASCHDAGVDRAPSREALRTMSPERVLDAMENGPMIPMANRRSGEERRAIAMFVTGKSFTHALDMIPPTKAMCAGDAAELPDPAKAPRWTGWGQNLANTRFQDGAMAGFTGADVPRLKVKWAFGFPGVLDSNGQPTVAGGRVFVGSQDRKVYSLNAATGCVYWYFEASASVRSAVSVGRVDIDSSARYAAFFGDLRANVYAVDAATGKLLWKAKADDFPVARITSSPAFYRGRLYVGVASGEEFMGATADYECCRFRGSVVAFDGATGKQVWKTYTIAEEPRPVKKNKLGVQQWGPSGAPIWSSPAVDVKRNVLYVATGDNYSAPATRTSDAFLALDIDSGKILWSRQMTPSDVWNSACRMPDKTNCPDTSSPDFDFGSSPILVTLPSGKRALIDGQKSGVVHALDPDQQGEVLWQTRIGQGGTMGGVQWGSAADQSNLYVALSDIGRIMLPYSLMTAADPKRGGGMFALRLDNGERVWYTPPPGCGDRKNCSPAQSAAVSAIPGVAFSGSVDGHLRAYSASSGTVVWDFDTIRPYETVNGVPGHGGSMDGPGPAIAGGMMFVNSGYAAAGGTPGNVLLAFSVDGK
jgi:polyvinyl alcohol dehydrogenase (cytochrome)